MAMGPFANRDVAQVDCSHDVAYISIIISVIPLWAIITTLIVFALLLIHKHIRLTKIYDNCTKQSAAYVYHVEIRTGDTSATYNRRKTTITIDMFDENQATLARIAIPGHVIFGRKESPVTFLDDDKYFELRVTRLWLYRSSRLRRVATIRLTHTCMEPEARIMVYGVELRLDEPERPKLFFPVMNYITPYGTANKINACFDFDPIGSISAMGGLIEPPLITDQLSVVDYILLVYLFCALVILTSTYHIIQNSGDKAGGAILQGVAVGGASFGLTLFVGLVLRFAIKSYYSFSVGSGLGAHLYQGYSVTVVVLCTGLWIWATIRAYNLICSNHYNIWALDLGVAVAVGVVLSIVCSLVSYLLSALFPVTTEQFTLPDEPGSAQVAKSGAQAHYEQEPERAPERNRSSSRIPSIRQPTSPAPLINTSPSALLMPTTAGPSTITGLVPWQQQTQQQPQPMYGGQQAQGYRGFGGGYDTTGNFQQPMPLQDYSAKTARTPLAPLGASRPTQQSSSPPNQAQSYHTQMTGATTTTSGRTKQTRKTGSNESTGSTYYQQLMKNKGGVKSISQYGELMKQKKNKR